MSSASGDVRRIIAIGVCCLLAAVTPFYAGASIASIFVLVPIALAIWLVTRSEWSSRTRVTSVLAVLMVTVALFVGLLVLAEQAHYFN